MLKSLIDNLFNRFVTKDEAVPLFGYVGRKPTSVDDRTPKIPQQSVERDINELIPVLSFKVGTETVSFTVQDLIRKAEVLGVSSDQASWLFSQANNYLPPIDLDRFTNFFNYYWVAKALPTTPVMDWNPTLAPEYYVIAKPAVGDSDKLNVVTSTTGPITLTGTGFYQQTWVVEFQSALDFTVTATGAGLQPAQVTQSFSLPSVAIEATSVTPVNFVASGISEPLLSFNVVRDPIYDSFGNWIGNESFGPGDTFTISAPFIASSYSVTPTSLSSGIKGKFVNIDSLDTYQTINGVTVRENDRVLVKDQGSSAENGIYVVQVGAFVRAPDYLQPQDGAIVFDKTHNLKFVSASNNTWTLSTDVTSNTNDWQEYNFWMHRDELGALGYDTTKAVQATRPIIEFKPNVCLNKWFDNGTPTENAGTEYTQTKSEFNQIPLFDLYRYDGTHAGKVSGIFFYAEDPTADVDPAIQRRVKKTTSSSTDFVFAHGLLDEDTSLFYKTTDGELHSIWAPGYSSAQVVDESFSGNGDGTFNVTVTSPFATQQIWTLVATSATTFSISGSKNKVLPLNEVTVGVPYSNGIVDILIAAGSTPFEVNDTYTFSVGNFETTRYVYRDEDGEISDLFGGPAADVNGVGAWLVPRMFYNNVAADNGSELPEGVLYSHFRGVLQNQIPGAELNNAFGGSIKLWSEQQNLLAALLMQRDLTPISMIDFAQRQYETAISQVIDIGMKEMTQYIASNGVINAQTIGKFVDYLLSIRAKDDDAKRVLYDTTSGVTGFPATLPQLGVTPLSIPKIEFDNVLGFDLITHHDGHKSPLYAFTQDLRDQMLSPGMLVKRSDGSMSLAIGSFTTTPPSNPYMGELWFYPMADGSQTLRVFDVLADGSIAPTANAVGQFWYERSAHTLYRWDGAIWAPHANILDAWVTIDFAEILNSVLLNVETRLYNNVNREHRTYFSESDLTTVLSSSLAPQLERELASWAAKNQYDPYGSDYKSSDAFTWNYKSLGLPARWYNVLKEHQQSVGILQTERPNIEPWKLLNYASKPAWWDTTYAATYDVNVASTAYARVVLFSDVALNTSLFGLPVVDGRVLQNGDVILLVSESSSANNGLWIISSGTWARHPTVLAQNLVVEVLDGNGFSGTKWVLTNTPATVNISPVIFDQARYWKRSMWLDILASTPSLKLSVDINRADVLLPPYVNPGEPASAYAITTSVPASASAPYEFGEGSPVESVWTKTVDFKYALAKAFFRAEPISFLGHCWGFAWVNVDDILYDGFDITVPGHERFRLHGDPIKAVTRRMPLTSGIISGPGPVDLTITYDGYTVNRKQSFSVKTADGLVLGYLHEGEVSSLSSAGYTLNSVKIEDEGVPFRVGDKFRVTANADGSGSLKIFEPISYAQFLGFGQIFTQSLRNASIDTSQGYAIQAYRGWTVNLGYRAGGLVSTDDLSVYTDSQTLQKSAFDLRFKRSQHARDLWLQGLRISVVQIGSSKPAVSGFVPLTDASDWAFRVEGFNPQYLGIEYYTLDTNGEFLTFNALSGAHTSREFKHFTGKMGVVKAELPIVCVGLQNLIDVVYGYAAKLEDDGWRFQDEAGGNIDAETGRTRTWQLEIEKLIDRIYAGIDVGQGHIMVPFVDRVWLAHDQGLLSEFFDSSLFDVTAHPAVFDTLGSKIHANDLTILRQREMSMISAAVPIFSAHVQLDEFEHLFVFNNLISPSTGEGLIYDPFSGARIVTIKMNGRKQASTTLRPEFGGHYLAGNTVRRNMQSSTDKVAHYYDAEHVFEDSTSTRHALALLGYSPKQYMENLDLSDHTQFNFWRGLVQMKGTNASVSAFLNNDRFQDAKIDEYWAYKVAEYGDSRPKLSPELKLTVDDALQQFTKLQFDATTTGEELSAFTQIKSDDEERWFSIEDLEDLNGNFGFSAKVVGRYERTFTSSDSYPQQIKLDFISDELDYAADNVLGDSAKLRRLNMTTLEVLEPCTVEVLGYGPSIPKFNPVKLLNYVDAELVQEIPVWHPAAGVHTPTAVAAINVIADTDPARYNSSTQVIGNANFDPLRAWGAREVGLIWWDTTKLDYVPYADSVIFTSIDERLSRWGTLADFASVDVVEWVESTVSPSDYDARAKIDAGDADLDSGRADGQVYGSRAYYRDRLWEARPIAWSKAGVPIEAAHPSFNASYNSTLVVANSGMMYLENGTFENYGIQTGMRIGGWIQNEVETRPTSEYLITGLSKHIVNGDQGSVKLEVQEYAPVVGELVFTSQVVNTPLLDADGFIIGTEYNTYLYVTEVASGATDTALLRTNTDNTFNITTPQTLTFNLPNFGLNIVLDLQDGVYNNGDEGVLIEALNGAQLFDAVLVQAIVAGTETMFVNDDENFIGWRAWNVPSQAELTADSRVPDSSWLPYVGEFATIVPTIEVVQQAASSSVTLNDGTQIERYRTSWSNWVELRDTTIRVTASETGDLDIDVPTVSADRVSVYVNGVAQFAATYSIVGNTLTLASVQKGSDIVVIIRAYSPSADELAFEPETEDNLLIQRNYKVDYQFVEIPIRGEDGTIISSKYYFWVKNRSVVARKKSLSVKAIASLLTTGPSQYLTFQHIKGA